MIIDLANEICFLRSFVSLHGPLASNLLIRECETSSIECNAFPQARLLNTYTVILVLLIRDLHSGYDLIPSSFITHAQCRGYNEFIKNNHYIIYTLYIYSE